MMSSAYPRSRRVTLRRKALLISSATLAMATAALAPQKASAQAFQGNPDPTNGIVTFDRGTPGVETITVGSQNATIFWAPTDTQGTGNIDFLPVNNTATFTNGQGIDNYTVLNRIVPTDPTRTIELNGTIESFINGSTGGNIWFFSPGGILVGPTAVIDVGSLLLTTLDPGNALAADSNGFTASFAPYGQSPPGSVVVNSGANISALQQNSYIALIAPRVEQHGNVQVNGSAAYVAAEQLTMTINQGLFDIQVDIGTADENGIVHSGTTGGPASESGADNHRIYMVAVPKEQALTMLLNGSSSIGFDEAVSAEIRNGEIILSAGSNVFEAAGEGLSFGGPLPGSASAHIRGSYTSDVTAFGTSNLWAMSDEWGSTSFTGDVSLRGLESAHIVAGAAQTLTVGGDAEVESDGFFDGTGGNAMIYATTGGTVAIAGDALINVDAHGSPVLSNPTAGSANLSADNATVTVGGSTTISASVWGNSGGAEGSSDSFGGNVYVAATNGGSLTLSDIEISAWAVGQSNDGQGDLIAGDGHGGSVNIHADTDGAITINGYLSADASGNGGDMYDGSTGGGAGYGGNVAITGGASDISVAGDVTLVAMGFGGSYFGEGLQTSGVGGNGQGGEIWIGQQGPGSITIGGNTVLDASASGGDSVTGGHGFGGNAGVTAYAGTITLGAQTTINSSGMGGSGSWSGNGGDGIGGTGWVEARGSTTGGEVPVPVTSLITGGNVSIYVDGVGGDGGASNGDNLAGSGGTGAGGLYTGELSSGGAFAASADGSAIHLGTVMLSAIGVGGSGGAGNGSVAGGAGGVAFGGTTGIGNYGPVGTPSVATYGAVSLDASAYGGDGGTGGAGSGAGGSATAGGEVFDDGTGRTWGGSFIDTLGTVEIANASLHANATGGDGSTGGDAIGGVVQAVAWEDTGSTLDIAGDLNGYALAWGGNGDTAGSATGGYAGFGALGGGSVDVGGRAWMDVSAAGGASPGTGGAGTGGWAEVLADGGSLTADTLTMWVTGFGGTGSTGGIGQGGLATVTVGAAGGSLDFAGNSIIAANGHGGAGAANSEGTGGAGGAGFGGDASLSISAAGTAHFGGFYVEASGVGGVGGSGITGGTGGDGYAATATITVDGELSVDVDSGAYAIGVGGNGGAGTETGGNGGAGYGSIADVAVDGMMTAGTLTVSTRGFGGAGGTGPTRGNGGYAEAGSSSLDIAGDATIDGVYVNATTFGGQGANGGEGVGGSSSAQVTGTLITGDLEVTAQGFGGTGLSGAGGNGTGGSSILDVLGIVDASNGELGNVFMGNGGYGGNGVTAGGSGQAGSTTIDVAGSLDIGTLLRIEGWATGGNASSGLGGSAEGGLVSITASEGASITGGDVIATAAATGGNGGSTGGNADGGTVTVESAAGEIDLAGTLSLDASGVAGGGLADGNGAGGTASLFANGGGTVALGAATIRADGTGGTSTSGDGGDGTGGTAEIVASGTGSSIAILGHPAFGSGPIPDLLSAQGFGGNNNGGGDLVAGSGTGGQVTLAAAAGADVTLPTTLASWGSTRIIARGTGGNAAAEGGTGGTGIGGTIDLGVDNATMTAVNLLVSSYAQGGHSANSGLNISGGDAFGGERNIYANNGGVLTLSAEGGTSGASGGNGSGSGNGGSAVGNSATLEVDGGQLELTGTLIIANQVFGGAGAVGGDASGGIATVTVSNGGVINSDNSTAIVRVGGLNRGGDGTIQGGSATGGSAQVEILPDSTIDLAGGLQVFVRSTGGDGPVGGDAMGGTADLYVEGALVAGGVELNAGANGGSSSAGEGGEARGGAASLHVGGGTLNVTGQTQILADAIGGAGTTAGGIAYGGWAGLDLFEGTATLSGNTVLNANGTGGAASAGTAGSSMGGDAYLDLWGSTLTANSVELTATGETGGYAEAGVTGSTLTANSLALNANGTATGGTAELYVGTLSGTPSSLTTGTFTASANGGTAAGEVYVDVSPGSSADLGIAELFATGGSGGFVQLLADGGDILASSLRVRSSGDIQFLLQNGGNIDVTGLIDGRANGVIALDSNAGGTLYANVLDLGSNGGITNSADLLVPSIYFATLADLTLGDLSASDLLSLSSAGNLTTGNLVSGGAIELGTDGILQTGDLTAAGLIDIDAMGNVDFGNVDAGSMTFDSMGSVTGGTIVADTFVNGQAEGAIALGDVTVGPGPEPAGELSVGFASNTSISVGDVTSYGRVGFATAGNLSTGDIQAGSLVMALVSGDISIGAITTAPDGTVYMAHGSMYLAAGGAEDNFDPALVLAAAPVATGGSITINGDVSAGTIQAYAGTDLTAAFIDAGTDILLNAGGLLTTGDLLAGNAVAGQAGGNVQIGNATAGQSIGLTSGGSIIAGILDAPTVSLSVAGDFTTGDLFVDETLLLAAGGNLTTGNISSGGSLGLTAGQNLQTGHLSAGGSVTLNAGGTLTAGDLTAGEGVAAQAGTTLTTGTIRTGYVAPPPTGESIGAMAVVASGQNVELVSGGNMTTGPVTSGENILLTSGGTLTSGALSAVAGITATSAQAMQIASATAGQALALTSATGLTTGSLAGQTVTTTATGASSVGAVNAGTSATFTAGGLATFTGVVAAPTIAVTSGDIDVIGGASLGVSGTTSLVTLNAVSNSPILIGGSSSDAAAGQYQLAEAGDIIASAIVINASAVGGGTAPDVLVRTVEIDGSDTDSVTLNTGGNVIVEGAVDYINAGSSDTLAINAGRAIEVVTDSGSISMSDSSGNLAGTLELTAADIWVADGDVIDQLEANPNFAGRDEALATNSGTANPAGFVQAGAVTANVSNSFLVQNSGTSEAPAGLTVGDGGLEVNNTASAPATAIIYGKQTKSDGSVVEGSAFVQDVNFAGSGGYTGNSSVNGCSVSGTCGTEQPPVVGGSETILGPLGMTNSSTGSESGSGSGEGEEEDEEGGEGETSVDPSVQLINTGPMQTNTTVDQPVTSGTDTPGGVD